MGNNEAPFLRSIAECDDDSARLIFADWLEEHGDPARAEFIRVQCELATASIAEERRTVLLHRERDLLDAHRQRWCESIDLPLDDIQFERGLISAARLARWDSRMLDPEAAAGLQTLTELDLSHLNLGDGEITAFAQELRLPALRKLILSDNAITDLGATALALAIGLPCLDTIYLFRNPVTDAARVTLEESVHFTLANLDMGERDDGYCMSPGQAEMARRLFVRTQLLPFVRGLFDTHKLLRSAMLCVAQYWNDEANDAVHSELIVSELLEPDIARAESEYSDAIDPNIPNTRIPRRYGNDTSSIVPLWDVVPWDDNNGAIPIWAAFASEGASQDMEFAEAYAPAVRFYRHGGYEFMPLLRPQLDGVQAESGWEE